MARVIDLDDDFDFGFSAVSEDELAAREAEAEERARKAAENIIRQQQEEASAVIDEVTATAQEYKDRLKLLHKSILPLLDNLIADADTKSFIYWPDRKAKIQQFKARLEAIVNG